MALWTVFAFFSLHSTPAWSHRARAAASIGQSPSDESELASVYGACPANNAVCVAIRMRSPMAASTCTEHCDEVAFRLTTTLQPGVDPEYKEGCGRCVEGDVDTNIQKHWAYDVVFPHDETTGETAPNTDVYKALVAPTMDKAFGCEKSDGSCQSAAFFAYGATGSGKSFTMGFEAGKTDGMMQLGVQQMFQTLTRLKAAGHPLGSQTVYMAFYELYGADDRGSRVFDLLTTGKERGKGERGSRESVLAVLNYVPIKDAEHMMELFAMGNKKRAVGGTGFNAMSSRSHAVVQFFITDQPIGQLVDKIAKGDRSVSSKLVSSLNDKSVQVMFVDLAGSEPAGNFEGIRRQEGMTINRALSALRLCIAAVADPTQHQCATRSDMLTEMLKGLFDRDRKTGKAKAFTRMLATLNPSADPGQIALSKGTMQYASTVKSIKIATPTGLKADNLVKITPDQVIAELKKREAEKDAQIRRLEEENAKLKIEVQELRQSTKTPSNENAPSNEGEKVAIEKHSGNTDGSSNDCEDSPAIKEKLAACDKAQGEVKTCQEQLGEYTSQNEQLQANLVENREAFETCQKESSLMNAQITEADTSSKLAAEEIKELREIVRNMLYEKAAVEDKKEQVSSEVLEARKQEACKLTKAASGLFSNWVVRPEVDSKLSAYQGVNFEQDQRAELIAELHVLLARYGEVVYSGVIADRLQGLISEELGPVQRRLLKVSKAIELCQNEMGVVSKQQEARIMIGIEFLGGFKNALIDGRPGEVDSSNPASVRFDSVLMKIVSNVNALEKMFAERTGNPEAQMEGVSKQISGSFCSLLPFLREFAGGSDECKADDGGAFMYESECNA